MGVIGQLRDWLREALNCVDSICCGYVGVRSESDVNGNLKTNNLSRRHVARCSFGEANAVPKLVLFGSQARTLMT